MHAFALKVKPSEDGLGTRGSKGLHFSWFVCGQDAKDLVSTLRNTMQAEGLEWDRVLTSEAKVGLKMLVDLEVGRAPGGDRELEDEAEDFTEYLDDELTLDRGE
jgi:hypothetical protein